MSVTRSGYADSAFAQGETLIADNGPIFHSIAIVGFGFMGGSLGLAVKRRWPSTRVTAVDAPTVAEAAVRMRAADVAAASLEAAGGAPLVVLAAPVRENIAMLRRLGDVIPGDAIVTDIGSTKSETVAAAAALPDRLKFVGGHPLAGAAVGGIAEARGDLFQGRPWLLTPDGSTDRAALAAVKQFVVALGAFPAEVSAAEHDRLVAYLSHLPQLTVTALMHVVGEAVRGNGLALAGSGLRDTTRLATSPPRVWRDIAATNAGQVSAALDSLIDVLQQLKIQVDNPDSGFDAIFTSAARWKQHLDDA